jgi:hypothetical protein
MHNIKILYNTVDTNLQFYRYFSVIVWETVMSLLSHTLSYVFIILWLEYWILVPEVLCTAMHPDPSACLSRDFLAA